MDRRTILKTLAATVAGATAIPAVQIAAAIEGNSIADLMNMRKAAMAHALTIDRVWRDANRRYQDVKPDVPRSILIDDDLLYSNFEVIDRNPIHKGESKYRNYALGCNRQYLHSSGWQLFYERMPHNPEYLEKANIARQWEAECHQAKVATGFAPIEQADIEAKRVVADIETAILNAPVSSLSDAHHKLSLIISEPNYAGGDRREDRLARLVQQLAEATA